MSLMFILIIVAAAVGGFAMWLSGLFSGMRSKAGGISEEALQVLKVKMGQMQRDLLAAGDKAEAALGAASRSEKARLIAVAEVDKMAVELGTIEEQLEELKKFYQDAATMDSSEMFATIPAEPIGDGEKADDALAELDMERVAHKKVREELEALKKLGRNSGEKQKLPHPGERRGPGFQTVSIASRDSNVSGTEHDRLRQAYDQLQGEKDRAESELARAQQELQLLKMRT